MRAGELWDGGRGQRGGNTKLRRQRDEITSISMDSGRYTVYRGLIIITHQLLASMQSRNSRLGCILPVGFNPRVKPLGPANPTYSVLVVHAARVLLMREVLVHLFS